MDFDSNTGGKVARGQCPQRQGTRMEVRTPLGNCFLSLRPHEGVLHENDSNLRKKP